MPSISDVFDALNDVKGKLDQVHADDLTTHGKIDTTNAELQAANGKLDVLAQAFTDLGTGIDDRLDELISGQQLANSLALHLTKQQQTIICAIEHVSQNTCELVNIADAQLRSARATESYARRGTRARAQRRPRGEDRCLLPTRGAP
jgi:hypothetical protein